MKPLCPSYRIDVRRMYVEKTSFSNLICKLIRNTKVEVKVEALYTTSALYSAPYTKTTLSSEV